MRLGTQKTSLALSMLWALYTKITVNCYTSIFKSIFLKVLNCETQVSLPDSMLPKLHTPASQPEPLHTARCAVPSGPGPKTKHPFPLSSFSYSLKKAFTERQLDVDLSLALEILIKRVITAGPSQKLAVITQVPRV